jgi:galactose oxidase-like protein
MFMPQIRITMILLLFCAGLRGQGSAWEEVVQAGPIQWGSVHAPVCYDANVGALLSASGYGGYDASGSLEGNLLTRVFDPVTKSWSVIPVTNPPGPLFGSRMAFDPVRGRSVLYGGIVPGVGPMVTNTWEFDGSDWVNLNPATNPGTRSWASMSYDPTLGGVILIGGSSQSLAPVDGSIWLWDGSNWTLIAPTTPGPAPRESASFCYDPVRGVHVLFGGRTANTPLTYMDDTWELDTSTMSWTQVMTAQRPFKRNGAASVFDPESQRVMIYGGAVGGVVGGPYSFDETWLFDGVNWIEVQSPTGNAKSRQGSALAVYPPTGEVFLFGGTPVPIFSPSQFLWGEEIWTWRPLSPSPYSGTGGDCRIDVRVGLFFDEGIAGHHQVAVGDFLGVSLVSPYRSLDGARLAFVYSLDFAGIAPQGQSLVGGGAPDIWINPATAVVALDGLRFPPSPSVPQINSQGTVVGSHLVHPMLFGMRAVMQVFVDDPGANVYDLSVSDAVIVDFI